MIIFMAPKNSTSAIAVDNGAHILATAAVMAATAVTTSRADIANETNNHEL